jgi:hypothetical protein
MTSVLPRRYRTAHPRHCGTPKELWGFRTPAVRGTPAAVARRFLRHGAGRLADISAALIAMKRLWPEGNGPRACRDREAQRLEEDLAL